DAAGGGVDDEQAGCLVVRDEEPPAVADGLDARGLDHRIGGASVALEQGGGETRRLEAERLAVCWRGQRRGAEPERAQDEARSEQAVRCVGHRGGLRGGLSWGEVGPLPFT